MRLIVKELCCFVLICLEQKQVTASGQLGGRFASVSARVSYNLCWKLFSSCKLDYIVQMGTQAMLNGKV